MWEREKGASAAIKERATASVSIARASKHKCAYCDAAGCTTACHLCQRWICERCSTPMAAGRGGRGQVDVCARDCERICIEARELGGASEPCSLVSGWCALL